jgi:Permuted papain-like amidase enzyme, YaeF/YiiX, C92 family
MKVQLNQIQLQQIKQFVNSKKYTYATLCKIKWHIFFNMYKKIIFFLLSLILSLILLFKLFFYSDSILEENQVQKEIEVTRLSQKEIELLSDGNIIMRRGYGFFSDFIAHSLNKKPFNVTHSGILYKKDNIWFVIHCLSSDVSNTDGMQEQPLLEFLKYSKPNSILITNIKDYTSDKGLKIVEKAKEYLKLKTPFDHIGIIDDNSKLYCSELIWQILEKDLGLVKLPKQTKQRKEIYYSMSALYDTSYFDIKLNQISLKSQK